MPPVEELAKWKFTLRAGIHTGDPRHAPYAERAHAERDPDNDQSWTTASTEADHEPPATFLTRLEDLPDLSADEDMPDASLPSFESGAISN